jgi:hypothetical protein
MTSLFTGSRRLCLGELDLRDRVNEQKNQKTNGVDGEWGGWGISGEGNLRGDHTGRSSNTKRGRNGSRFAEHLVQG